MQRKRISEFFIGHRRGLMAAIPALAALICGLIFALVLPGQAVSGNMEGLRWFAFSAFPLAIIVGIAAVTRVQRRLNRIYGQDESHQRS